MKHINKGDEPEELKVFKTNSGVNYKKMKNNATTKKAVKLALLKEQGFICCYCGRKIDFDNKTGIEHFLPKSDFPYLDLYYRNLFACCDGGRNDRAGKKVELGRLSAEEKNKDYPVFCDVCKDNGIIPLSPLDQSIEKQFMYYEDGTMEGMSEEAEDTIKKLNLSNPVLNNRRKAAIAAYEEEYYDSYSVEQWREEIKFLETKDSQGKFEEYCFVKKRYIEEFKLS